MLGLIKRSFFTCRLYSSLVRKTRIWFCGDLGDLHSVHVCAFCYPGRLSVLRPSFAVFGVTEQAPIILLALLSPVHTGRRAEKHCMWRMEAHAEHLPNRP